MDRNGVKRRMAKGFHMERIKRDYAFDMHAKHAHDMFEIYYLLSGERHYFIQNRTYHVKKGDLVLIRPYVLHRTSQVNASNQHERILINFHDSFLTSLREHHTDFPSFPDTEHPPLYHLQPGEQSYVENLLWRMLDEKKQRRSGYAFALKLLLSELLLFAERQRNEKQAQATPSDPAHTRILDIVQYMNEHYDQPLSLSTIAQTFHVSPYTLSRQFKKITGFKYVEYLNHIRITQAQYLLRITNLKVAEVGLRVGYDNPTHFGRMFKQITGMSPRRFKQMTPQ